LSTQAPVQLVSYVAAGGVAPGCLPGYVWRDARDGDGVCVTPADRDVAHNQNAEGQFTHLPGTNGCRPGYVWRDAWDGDGVCVTPSERDQVHRQNAEAASHSVSASSPVPIGPSPHPTPNPCPTYDGTAASGNTVGNVSPNRYFTGGSPELGAQWNKCAATVTITFRGGLLNEITHYNLRINGAQSEVTTTAGATHAATVTMKDSQFKEGSNGIVIQACHRGGVFSSSTCTAWSPQVNLLVHVGSTSQG
jgi:hypothetical protein